jgi:UDP-glucose 4-epimerase
VYAGDVVAANLAALGRKGFNIYNVGTGIETDVNTLFDHIHRSVGRGPRAIHGAAKSGEQQRSSISAALLERELGVTVSTPLADGIKTTADWFKEN